MKHCQRTNEWLKDTFHHPDSQVCMYLRSYMELSQQYLLEQRNGSLEACILDNDNIISIMMNNGALAV